MRSIVYCGQDFSELCSAEVVGRTATPVVAEAMDVPGRAGALLVSERVPPVNVTVRLYLDVGFKMDAAALADARRRLSFWLCVPGGGELVLPDDPERTYRDALMVDAGEWSKLFSDGQCEVTFTLFDPIACRMERAERGPSFAVAGTFETWPVFTMVAAAGPYVRVAERIYGRYVLVEHTFAGGEVVVVDCASESVTIDGVDARADVAFGSDFFALQPGERRLVYSGCDSQVAEFRERWL